MQLSELGHSYNFNSEQGADKIRPILDPGEELQCPNIFPAPFWTRCPGHREEGAQVLQPRQTALVLFFHICTLKANNSKEKGTVPVRPWTSAHFFFPA